MLSDNWIVLFDGLFDDLSWINSDFSSSNFTAFRSAHDNTFWTISVNNLLFCFGFFYSTSITTLPIKLDIFIFAYFASFFISENKNRIYIENKIDEMSDFCEISVRIARAACFFSSNANFIFQSIMNDLIHRINWLSIFSISRITFKRSVDKWLNASFTSRNRHEKMVSNF